MSGKALLAGLLTARIGVTHRQGVSLYVHVLAKVPHTKTANVSKRRVWIHRHTQRKMTGNGDGKVKREKQQEVAQERQRKSQETAEDTIFSDLLITDIISRNQTATAFFVDIFFHFVLPFFYNADGTLVGVARCCSSLAFCCETKCWSNLLSLR